MFLAQAFKALVILSVVFVFVSGGASIEGGDDALFGKDKGPALQGDEKPSSGRGERGRIIGPIKEQPADIERPVEPEKPAEPAKTPAQAVEKAAPAETAPSPARRASVSSQAGGVSFFFDDADVYEVVQTVFGDVLKLNYIIDPAVKGRVNFRSVSPIPMDDVLPVMEVILRLNGIGFVEEKKLYRVVPLGKVSKELIYSQIGKSPENVAVELFSLKNMNINESMPDIENSIGLMVQGGTVRVIPVYRLNALIVVASSREQMDYVRKWVETLDGIFAGAKTRIFVYPIQNSKAVHIASLMQEIFSIEAMTVSAKTKKPDFVKSEPAKTVSSTQSSSEQSKPEGYSPPSLRASNPSQGGGAVLVSSETKILADEITNSIIVLSTPSDYALIEETIKKLDIVPRQVLIEMLVAEATLSDELKFGIEWFIKSKYNIGDTGLKGNITFDSVNIGAGVPGFSFTALDSANVVRGLLQTLASESKLKVLASPHILVSDNREAKIQVGSQVPIVTSEISSAVQTGGSTGIQRNIQYKDTGVILKVLPQINDGGLVSLDVTQEVSDVREAIKSGVQSPVIFKREAATNIVVQDGQTIVIGGLIQDRNERAREGLPFLSKIPILGFLFGYTKDTEDRTELVVLITPHVVKNAEEARKVTSDYMDKLKGLKVEPPAGGGPKPAGESEVLK